MTLDRAGSLYPFQFESGGKLGAVRRVSINQVVRWPQIVPAADDDCAQIRGEKRGSPKN